MNFTKYASAAALLATAVYASEVKPLTPEELVTAFNDCKNDPAVTEVFKCMVEKHIKKEYAEEAAKHNENKLSNEKAQEIIATVKAKNQQSPPPPPAPEGGWYKHMTDYKWSYGIGIPIAAVAICGGLYMAVGRKPADDADL